jgi:hypothetical protein
MVKSPVAQATVATTGRSAVVVACGTLPNVFSHAPFGEASAWRFIHPIQDKGAPASPDGFPGSLPSFSLEASAVAGLVVSS